MLSGLATGGCASLVGGRLSRRAEAAERSHPPTGQLLKVNGKTVHADIRGEGPDLVLIHGASGNTRDFTFSIADKLADRYRVISFDRPGLGWSEDLGPEGISPIAQAEHLIAAGAQIGLRNPVVLGQSYGGAVALAWALSAPANTAALVLVAAASMPWPGGLGAWYHIAGSKIGGATVVPLISAFAPVERAESVIDAIFEPQEAPQGYAEYVGVGLTMRTDVLRVNARQVNTLKPYLEVMSKDYSTVAQPVELIHGTADTIVPIAIHSEPIAKLLPNARLERLSGIGHMPHHVAEPEVIAAVDRAALRAGLR